jgi:hypothetical protein
MMVKNERMTFLMLNYPKTLLVLFLGCALLLVACVPPAGDPETEVPLATSPPAPTQYSTPPEPGTRLPDEQAGELMYTLAFGSEPQEALDTVLEAGDTRFIAVLIELMRANQIRLVQGAGYAAHIQALEALSRQDFGDDWPAWVVWYGATDLEPPPGFTGWKGELLGGIDPGFREFLQDDHPSTIRVEEIQWGGVRVDGIPALDNATMIPADQADYLEAGEPVFGLSINGDQRAYPLRILDWHEMANDVVGGVPVSLAYCTLCGAGIAFDGRAPDGQVYTFGSSGFLFRSNKLMYDRQTRTLWNQITGEPVLGELVGSGVELDLLPVVVTSWGDWLAQHPDTLVLDLDTGYQRPYLPGAAYGSYFADPGTMFPVWQRSQLLETKQRVYALQVEGVPKAYPLEVLIAEGVVNDSIGDTDLVLIASRGDIRVQAGPATEYNAGGEVRAYKRMGETFSPGPDADTLIDSNGRTWKVTEDALVSPEGERAPRLGGHLAYWFGWYAFFPNTLLYEQP